MLVPVYFHGLYINQQCITVGFTSDVKLWEVVFNKSGEFTEVTRAMELSGHRASVLSMSFSSDSKRCVCVCEGVCVCV